MFQTFAAASFQSIWYWVLHVVVWTLACYRTLGVPHDMLLRARRVPEAAAKVDILARLSSERIGGIHDRYGVPIAAAAGFALAGLAALGFSTGIEAAQAGFALLMPFIVVSYSKLRLALAIRRRGIAGTELRPRARAPAGLAPVHRRDGDARRGGGVAGAAPADSAALIRLPRLARAAGLALGRAP